MKNEFNFTIEGVQGELKLEASLFKQKLYQDGREVSRKRGKYYVTNTSGESEEMRIIYGLDFVHTVLFRGQKYLLEEKLSRREYILGGLPVLLVFLGGLVGAAVGFMGAIWVYDYFRKEKRLPRQILAAIGVSAICFVLYMSIAFFLGFLLGRY